MNYQEEEKWHALEECHLDPTYTLADARAEVQEERARIEQQRTEKQRQVLALYEEHMAALEEEHERTLYCGYEQATGDKRWPVLCLKDNRYAKKAYCDKCKREREARI